MTFLPALAFGFALGMRHATDADHIAAISTLLTGSPSPRRAVVLGSAWGVGHSASVLLVGGTMVLFRLTMPQRVALGLELLAAMMLILLGARSLFARRGAIVQASAARPLAVGVVHGLAGSAVLVLLVLGATTTVAAAGAYLLCFCIGTIFGMSLVTVLLSLPGRLDPVRARSMDHGVRVVAGMASVAIGLAMAHRLGVAGGLFAVTPGAPGR